MTIQDAINRLDNVKPNKYSKSQKVKWLSLLDSDIKYNVLDRYTDGAAAFAPYTDETSPETELLVGEPYDMLYEYWLEAQIDYANREFTAYNNAMAMYNEAYAAFRNDFNRRHTHKQTAVKTI